MSKVTGGVLQIVEVRVEQTDDGAYAASIAWFPPHDRSPGWADNAVFVTVEFAPSASEAMTCALRDLADKIERTPPPFNFT